jgi:hypothetical protein
LNRFSIKRKKMNIELEIGNEHMYIISVINVG